MARILAFSGSPRADGHSGRLLGELIKGAESRGAEVKVYDLNNPGLRGCQSCFACRAKPGCSVRDYLAPVYEEMADAAGVVLSSPIYFASISGQAKLWLDRMFPMLDGQSFLPRYPGKRAVTIFSQGDGNPDRFGGAIRMVHGFFKTFGWDMAESIVCSGASAPGFVLSNELMKMAHDAGAALAE